MDLVRATLILPLAPLFLVPLALVLAAWLDRSRHARRAQRRSRKPGA